MNINLSSSIKVLFLYIFFVNCIGQTNAQNSNENSITKSNDFSFFLKNSTWEILKTSEHATGRHETSFVNYKGKFYLIGGRGIKSVDVYDPSNNTWTAKKKSPIEINHFQAVVFDNSIYMVGAMNGTYPIEKPLQNVWIYKPEKDQWIKGKKIPKEHRRGGSGCVVYDNKIYLACGIENGHTSGTNNLFSCYDPKQNTWTFLTKAPHVRDHFAAIVNKDKLYCIGGRNSSVHNPNNFNSFFYATEKAVDVYDFKTNKWCTLKNPLPVPTAAGGIVSLGHYLIYMGGEGPQYLAYSQTQCLNLNTGKWSMLAPMTKGLHGSNAILYKNRIYWAAGSFHRGGSNLNTLLMFSEK